MGSAPSKLLLLSVALIAMFLPSAATAAPASGNATAYRLVAGLQGGSGSTIGPDRALYVADLGTFSVANPPASDFFVASGVQYALQADRGGLLVTDGHHNRVLGVTGDGQITELRGFANIVPTGLEVGGGTIYVAEAGPVPHLPEDGKVVAFRPRSSTVRDLAAGGRLLVDVEFGPRHRLYALSQGVFVPGNPEGSPAEPNTGALVKANRDGSFTVLVDRLNQPTSLEFINNTAYVVTLSGEIWKIKGL